MQYLKLIIALLLIIFSGIMTMIGLASLQEFNLLIYGGLVIFIISVNWLNKLIN